MLGSSLNGLDENLNSTMTGDPGWSVHISRILFRFLNLIDRTRTWHWPGRDVTATSSAIHWIEQRIKRLKYCFNPLDHSGGLWVNYYFSTGQRTPVRREFFARNI